MVIHVVAAAKARTDTIGQMQSQMQIKQIKRKRKPSGDKQSKKVKAAAVDEKKRDTNASKCPPCAEQVSKNASSASKKSKGGTGGLLLVAD